LLSRFVLEMVSSGRSAFTIRNYRLTIQHWQDSGLGPMGYLAALNVSPSTRMLGGRMLKRYLAWEAARNGGDNPLADMHFRTPPPDPVRPFSPSEIAALMAACRTRLEEAIILCLLKLGLRASELARVTEVDIEEGAIRIHGKGGKTRLLGASPAIMRALVTLCEGRLTYQAVYRTVKALGQRTRLARVHPHRFRHTFAHDFLAAGGDIGDLRVLLGHSSWGQTARYAAFYEGERAVSGHRRFLEAG